jgi:hypothetical protein
MEPTARGLEVSTRIARSADRHSDVSVRIARLADRHPQMSERRREVSGREELGDLLRRLERCAILAEMRSSLRPLSLAAVLAVAALVCCYAGMILQGTLHHAAPALAPPVLGVAPLVYLLFMRRIPPREALGPRAFPATVLVTLVAAPVFAGLAHVALALPIVKLTDGRDPEALDSTLVFLAALVASIAVVSAAAAWLRGAERRGAAALLALAAPAAVAAALALALTTAGLSSPRPAPDGYVSALPIVARTPDGVPPTGEDVTEVGNVAVTRRCPNRGPCGVWLTRRGEAVPRGNIPDFSVNEPIVLVRRDVARDLWLVDGSLGQQTIFAENEPPHQAAYRGADVARVEVRPSTLRGGLAPPRGWIVAALLGALIAVRRLWRRRGASKALAEILAAEPGTLDEGGWIVLDRGGDPLRAPPGLAAGPVLVVAPTAGAAGAYRTDAARPADRVLAGTRAYLAEEARHALTTIDARVLATTLITVAPLVTAWIEGLR